MPTSEYQEKSLSRIGLRKMYIGSLTLTMFIALFVAITLALILGRQLAQASVNAFTWNSSRCARRIVS
jgi:nitrogen fixation/metabolism regulation signal transduction histidine kinase